MPSRRRSKLTRTLKALWHIPTVALILSSLGCAVKIKDFQTCSPIPGELGAACDWFLTDNQEILNEAQWQALQASWVSQGQAVECFNSNTLGDIKGELEKLCSKAPCTYQAHQQIAKIQKLIDMGLGHVRSKKASLESVGISAEGVSQ